MIGCRRGTAAARGCEPFVVEAANGRRALQEPAETDPVQASTATTALPARVPGSPSAFVERLGLVRELHLVTLHASEELDSRRPFGERVLQRVVPVDEPRRQARELRIEGEPMAEHRPFEHEVVGEGDRTSVELERHDPWDVELGQRGRLRPVGTPCRSWFRSRSRRVGLASGARGARTPPRGPSRAPRESARWWSPGFRAWRAGECAAGEEHAGSRRAGSCNTPPNRGRRAREREPPRA